jgi:hypothetical protein
VRQIKKKRWKSSDRRKQLWGRRHQERASN